MMKLINMINVTMTVNDRDFVEQFDPELFVGKTKSEIEHYLDRYAFSELMRFAEYSFSQEDADKLIEAVEVLGTVERVQGAGRAVAGAPADMALKHVGDGVPAVAMWWVNRHLDIAVEHPRKALFGELAILSAWMDEKGRMGWDGTSATMTYLGFGRQKAARGVWLKVSGVDVEGLELYRTSIGNFGGYRVDPLNSTIPAPEPGPAVEGGMQPTEPEAEPAPDVQPEPQPESTWWYSSDEMVAIEDKPGASAAEHGVMGQWIRYQESRFDRSPPGWDSKGYTLYRILPATSTTGPLVVQTA